MVDLQGVSELLRYDAENGKFFWRVTRGPRAMAGSEAGKRLPNGYITITIRQRAVYAHRLAWLFITGQMPDRQIDHINRDRADNRAANLRLACPRENIANAAVKSTSKTGFKGVTKRGQRYIARIRRDGKRVTLGWFDTPQLAAQAYQAEAGRLYGEFAGR